jgi:hypothetical protein
VRHVWLIDRIHAVCAELLLGQGIAVGHQAVEQLMRPAGIPAAPSTGSPRCTRAQE